MIIIDLLENSLFAGIAAIGFGSISNIPLKSFPGCALLAAIAHTSRLVLMQLCGWNIIMASFVAAISIGLLSIPLAKFWRCPAEALSFPALLPMIPGMYAYRAVQSLLICLQNKEEISFEHYFNLFNYNCMICFLTMLMMAVGVLLPIFIFRSSSFSVTR
ncbi:MAG TPA: threonine/serine exporter family protein [Bacteroidetes bacterium]|nr:threonine/serine exporter family protein [Candidatus Limimorpha avicola]